MFNERPSRALLRSNCLRRDRLTGQSKSGANREWYCNWISCLKIYRHVISQKWINTWPVLWRELFCDVNWSIALVGFQFEFLNKISWETNRFCRKPTYLQQHCFRTQARFQIMRLRKWYPWYSITLRHTSKHCEAIAYLKSFLRLPNSHFCGFKDVNTYVAWCCRPPEL